MRATAAARCRASKSHPKRSYTRLISPLGSPGGVKRASGLHPAWPAQDLWRTRTDRGDTMGQFGLTAATAADESGSLHIAAAVEHQDESAPSSSRAPVLRGHAVPAGDGNAQRHRQRFRTACEKRHERLVRVARSSGQLHGLDFTNSRMPQAPSSRPVARALYAAEGQAAGPTPPCC